MDHLEANFHCSFCNGKVCPPNIVERKLLLCNGSKQLLNPVLEAHGVHIQCPVEVVDALFSQTRQQQCWSVYLVNAEALHDNAQKL